MAHKSIFARKSKGMIRLLWEQLRYDIELQTYNISQMRMTDRVEGDDKRNYDEVVSDESLEDMILRYCETGTARLYALLRKRLESTDAAGDATDALDHKKKEWAYQLTDTDDASERALAMLMHKFVVAWALGEWAKQFAADQQAAFASEADETLAEIEDEAFSFKTPVKKRRAKVEDVEDVTVEYL